MKWRVCDKTLKKWDDDLSLDTPESTHGCSVRRATGWISRLLWVHRIAGLTQIEIDFAMEQLVEWGTENVSLGWDRNLSGEEVLKWETMIKIVLPLIFFPENGTGDQAETTTVLPRG